MSTVRLLNRSCNANICKLETVLINALTVQCSLFFMITVDLVNRDHLKLCKGKSQNKSREQS